MKEYTLFATFSVDKSLSNDLTLKKGTIDIIQNINTDISYYLCHGKQPFEKKNYSIDPNTFINSSFEILSFDALPCLDGNNMLITILFNNVSIESNNNQSGTNPFNKAQEILDNIRRNTNSLSALIEFKIAKQGQNIFKNKTYKAKPKFLL